MLLHVTIHKEPDGRLEAENTNTTKILQWRMISQHSRNIYPLTAAS